MDHRIIVEVKETVTRVILMEMELEMFVTTVYSLLTRNKRTLMVIGQGEPVTLTTTILKLVSSYLQNR